MKRFLYLVVLLTLFIFSCQKPSRNITTLKGEYFYEDDLRKNKLSAIVFLVPGCPLSEAALFDLKKLDSQYKRNGYNTYISIPGNLFDKEEVIAFADSFDIQFPVLLDTAALLVYKFKASITPEYFLVDSNLNIIYQGAIDDRAFDNDYIRQEVKIQYAKNAIEEFLENKKISIAKTKAVGCFIEL